MVIRHQASVMAVHSTSGGLSNAPTNINRIQVSDIKTMVFASVLYAVTWLPNYTYVFVLSLYPNPQLHDSGYYASVFIAFLYICINLLSMLTSSIQSKKFCYE